MSAIGYIIFHRHGHRSPIRNLLKSENDVTLWKSLLPHEDRINSLSKWYPIHGAQTNPETFDSKTFPFGCITEKGLDHLTQIGAKAKLAFPKLSKTSSIKVFSTNYQRTQVIFYREQFLNSNSENNNNNMFLD